MALATEIEKKIIEQIEDADVRISSKDDKHFEGIVISSLFEGKSLVEQHRIVMNSLKELFTSSLHAFHLQTYTPNTWNEKNLGD